MIQHRSKATQWYRRSAEGGYFCGQYTWATALVAAGKIDEAAHWLVKTALNATPEMKIASVSYAAQIDHPAMWAIA